MSQFYAQFSVFIEEFKAQRGLNKAVAQRPAPAVHRVLTEAERKAAMDELDLLLPQYDPAYEYAAGDAAYEAGKRVEDRIRFLTWYLSAA
ncbi:hypothetical protein [Azohydromonas lata]|uniref:hypothetical protein n=1 Tax=Azohydromonas lata TaxID=45677 RepID=UPI00082FE89A|nr:hypothetical protein [Azohydromonas lata]